MQEWLNERKLDRKALTALSTNLAGVEAWEEYVLEEAEAVVRSLVAAVAGEPEDGEAEEDGSERPPGGSVSASDAEDGETDAAAPAEGLHDRYPHYKLYVIPSNQVNRIRMCPALIGGRHTLLAKGVGSR